MGFTFRDGDGNEIKQANAIKPLEPSLPASTYEDIINRLREENKKLKSNIETLKKLI